MDRLPSDTLSQNQRLLEHLRHALLTTFQSRQELDIHNPAARVHELKAQGYNIVTHWTTEDSGKAKHRIAKYVLLMGATDE